MLLTTFTSLLAFSAAHYTLQDNYAGVGLLQSFDYFSEADPTQGTVKFLDRTSALQETLLGVIPDQNDAVYIGVDHTSKSTEGRKSLRLISKKSYNHGLFVADIAHMPGGICGVWPAFWLLGSGTWPTDGEIDIFEGVNDQKTNAMTLHTSSGCAVKGTTFSGNLTSGNCDINAPDQGKNTGCGIQSKDQSSYGTSFNSAGGGVYATEWNGTAISIWFFPRSSIPADVDSGSPDPSKWGLPAAQFGGACDIDQHFKDMNIILDTTFCGEWAGKVWDQNPTCKAKANTCEDFVAQNPQAFVDAYWSINHVKVYIE